MVGGRGKGYIVFRWRRRRDQRLKGLHVCGFSSGLVVLCPGPQNRGQGLLSMENLAFGEFSSSPGADWGLENLAVSSRQR